jgi:hypothetical protein
MKRFLIQSVLFISIFCLLDWCISRALKASRPVDYRQFVEAKQEFFDRPANVDFLIVGDSHIADALDPSIIKQKIGLSAFNLGVYHASPYEWYYLSVGALRNCQIMPKHLIVGTNPDMFKRDVTVGKYTPLIVNDFQTQLELYLNSPTGLDKSFFFQTLREDYLFNSLFSQLKGKKYIPTRVVKSISNGYLETTNQMPNVKWDGKETNSYEDKKINNDQIRYFIQLIEFAESKNVKVLVVNSPIWSSNIQTRSEHDDFKKTKELIDSISMSQGIPVFNSDYLIALKQSDFLNTDHLNGYGAKKFSAEFCKWYKSLESSPENLDVNSENRK